ncbi:MAG: hypothetical protein WCE32_01705 [Pseudolabrys sp.]
MFIRLKNGSTWQVIGSDNYDTLVGSPPAGIVFSEWSRANPASWAYLAPILVENRTSADFHPTQPDKTSSSRCLTNAHQNMTGPAMDQTLGERRVELLGGPVSEQRMTLHWSAVSAMQRPATIWHMLPQIAMARKAICPRHLCPIAYEQFQRIAWCRPPARTKGDVNTVAVAICAEELSQSFSISPSITLMLSG